MARLVRAEYLVDVVSLTKVEGTPFKVGEVEHAALELLAGLGEVAAGEAVGEGQAIVDPEELL